MIQRHRGRSIFERRPQLRHHRVIKWYQNVWEWRRRAELSRLVAERSGWAVTAMTHHRVTTGTVTVSAGGRWQAEGLQAGTHVKERVRMKCPGALEQQEFALQAAQALC